MHMVLSKSLNPTSALVETNDVDNYSANQWRVKL